MPAKLGDLMDFEKIKLTNVRAFADAIPLKKGSLFSADMTIDGKLIGFVMRDFAQFTEAPFGTWFRWVWYRVSKRVNAADFFWSRLEETLKVEEVNLIKNEDRAPAGRKSPDRRKPPRERKEGSEAAKAVKLMRGGDLDSYVTYIDGIEYSVLARQKGEWLVGRKNAEDIYDRIAVFRTLQECREYLAGISKKGAPQTDTATASENSAS